MSTHTSGECWRVNNAEGRLPIVREIKRPHGEAPHYEASITSADRKTSFRVDFGYGYDGRRRMEDIANLVAAAPEMRDSLGEVFVMLGCELKGYANEPWAQRVIALIDRLEGNAQPIGGQA